MRTKEQAQAEYNGWSAPKIARRWGVDTDSVYNAIKNGDPPLRAIKVGGRYAVLHEDLMAYEALNETAPREDAA